MGESGRGLYMLTKGSKTSIPYLEEIAAESKRPVLIAALFHSNTNPTRAFTTLGEVNAARSRGHQLLAQTSCCPLSMDFTFKSPYLFESMRGVEAGDGGAATGRAARRSTAIRRLARPGAPRAR